MKHIRLFCCILSISLGVTACGTVEKTEQEVKNEAVKVEKDADMVEIIVETERETTEEQIVVETNYYQVDKIENKGLDGKVELVKKVVYDKNGNIVETYGYDCIFDGSGNFLGLNESKFQNIEYFYTYNDRNQVEKFTENPKSHWSSERLYIYDDSGRLQRREIKSGTTDYQFSYEEDRFSRSKYEHNRISKTEWFDYDGKVIQSANWLSDGKTSDDLTIYTYNNAGALLEIKNVDYDYIRYTARYDENGNITYEKSDTTNGYGWTYIYDENQRLVEIRAEAEWESYVRSSYIYDDLGRIVYERGEDRANPWQYYIREYTYNDVVLEKKVEHYSNREMTGEYSINTALGEKCIIEYYNSNGNISKIEQYDEKMQITSWQTYEYNDEGKLLRIGEYDRIGFLVNTVIYSTEMIEEQVYVSQRNEYLKK